jgi:hypothetical protein
MKKYATTAVLLLLICSFHSYAQYSRYLIKLKDKGGNSFSIANPGAYLGAVAV